MSARTTSKASFIDVQEGGIAAAQRVRILNYIRLNPGKTRREICAGLNGVIEMSSICGRVNELLNSDAIYENGAKHNPQTGKSANCLYVRLECAA